MIIAGLYSFNRGQEIIESQYGAALDEVKQVISTVDSAKYKHKISKEKTKLGQDLYSPPSLNRAFKQEFDQLHWRNHRVACEYPTEYYIAGFTPTTSSQGAFRDMDFVKNRVGVEVQFGKYAFMVYNVCAKMTIFHNLDVIDVGIEIVPVKDFVIEMSSEYPILSSSSGIYRSGVSPILIFQC
jgi:hypothetical protein